MEELASSPLPALAPASDGELEERLLLLMATLPRQTAGERDGVLKVEGYLRVLRGLAMPVPQIEFMVDAALARCAWMPAPTQLVEMAGEWERDDHSLRCQRNAKALARREREARFDETRAALRRGELDQDAIDALDEWSAMVFEAEGLLWRCDCGSYVARPQHTMDAAIESFDQVRAAMAGAAR